MTFKLGNNSANLLALFEEHKQLTTKQIADMTGMSTSSIHDTIYRLRNRKLVYLKTLFKRRVGQKAGMGAHVYALGNKPDAVRSSVPKPAQKPRKQVYYTPDEFIGAMCEYQSYGPWGQLVLHTGAMA